MIDFNIFNDIIKVAKELFIMFFLIIDFTVDIFKFIF
jgi:hypothetical protein